MDAELDLFRRVANLVRVGVVHSADYSAALVRVQVGENVTNWLPWVTLRAGGDRTWWAPEVGEQVIVLSPSGEMENGIALPAAFRAGQAPAASPDVHVAVYADGTEIKYDRAAHKMTTKVIGDVVVESGGNLSATVTGNVAITAGGNVTADGAAVILNGGGMGGVVCQQHVCAFTGMPHPQGSGTVSAGD